MKFKPHEYQQQLIDHGVSNDLTAWFVGMGLGKTASRLAVWDRLFTDCALRGVLVVAPLRVANLTWSNEVEKWENFRWLKVANLRTKSGQKAWEEGAAHIYTINYESLPKFTEKYLKNKKASELPVDEVFFDESDNAKNPSSKRINFFRKWGRNKFRRCGIQTGTPISNSRLDLFAQIRLLDKGETFGNAYGKWAAQYFEPENTWSQYPKLIPRQGAEELLENAVSHLTKTLKTEDWISWTPHTTRDEVAKLPPEAKKIYNEVEKDLLAQLESGEEVVAVNSAVLVGKLLQITGGNVYTDEGGAEPIHDAKLDALKKIQKRHKSPLLVACQYRHEIERVLEEVDGAEEFTEARLDAWNAGDVPVMVAHPKSIGHGLNLQDGGHVIVWYSLNWSRGLYDQFNARLARQGQKQETIVYHIVIPETVDDAVLGALDHKGKDQAAFLNTLSNIQKLKQK